MGKEDGDKKEGALSSVMRRTLGVFRRSRGGRESEDGSGAGSSREPASVEVDVSASTVPVSGPTVEDVSEGLEHADGSAVNVYIGSRRSSARHSSYDSGADATIYGPMWGRRHHRRGPFQRMFYPRQRWMFSSYDWNLQEFDRSSLYSSASQQMRFLEYFDDLTYEEMIALGEHIGKVTRGLTEEEITQLPMVSFKLAEHKGVEQETTCSICLDGYIEGEMGRLLRCDHMFHVNCVDSWLRENKTCPVCKVEVCVQMEANGDMEGEAEGSEDEKPKLEYGPRHASADDICETRTSARINDEQESERREALVAEFSAESP